MENKESFSSLRGKLAQTSQNFRKYFLLEFTKQLVLHTKIEEFYKLQNVLKKKSEEKPKPKEEEKEEDPYLVSLMHLDKPRKFKPLPKPPQVKPLSPPSINPPHPHPNERKIPRPRPLRSPRIPNYPLPQRLQYLQPYPTDKKLDLKKLNPLLQDPAVKLVECNGPGERVIVKGAMGTKPTGIILSKNEINEILGIFSLEAKIPLNEGVYKIAAGNLLLSAIISDVIGSKFIITKMQPPQQNPSRY